MIVVIGSLSVFNLIITTKQLTIQGKKLLILPLLELNKLFHNFTLKHVILNNLYAIRSQKISQIKTPKLWTPELPSQYKIILIVETFQLRGEIDGE